MTGKRIVKIVNEVNELSGSIKRLNTCFDPAYDFVIKRKTSGYSEDLFGFSANEQRYMRPLVWLLRRHLKRRYRKLLSKLNLER